MTYSDKRNLLGGGVLMLLVTIATVVSLKPSFEDILSIILPQNLETSLIATVSTTIVSALIVVTFYSGGTDPHHTTKYYLIQPGMEEIIFRFNSLILIHVTKPDLSHLILLSVIQATVFGLIHGSGIIKHAILGLVWIIGAYYGGIITAITAHTIGNLTYRVRARAHHGWYDTDD